MTTDLIQTPAILTSDRITIDDWLLTEAVRHQEEAGGRRRDDDAAVTVGMSTEGGADRKLLARARALPGSREVLADIARLRKLLRGLAVGLIGIGVLSGVLAARAGMRERQIDILLSTVTLVGLPTIMLALWLVVLLLTQNSGGSAGTAGRLLVAGLVRLAPRLLHSPLSRELLTAGLELLRRRPGRWYLSALSHGLWLAFALSAISTLSVYFSVVQYNLSWGTTLLDETTVVGLIHGLAALPSLVGIIPPVDPEWIAAGREGALLGSDRASWARFMLSMILIYAAAPRVLLLIACFAAGRWAVRDLTFDHRQPGYLRLLPLLQPATSNTRIHGSKPSTRPPRPHRTSPRSAGPPVLIGVELERGDKNWPPSLPDLEIQVLGQVDRRAQRRELAAALAGLERPPRALIAVCSMLRTPDAGTEDLLNRLADAAGSALIVILDDESRLNRRGGDIDGRRADWQALAERCGGQALAVDLSDSVPASLERLQMLLTGVFVEPPQ